MALLALSYPSITNQQRQWIQEIRQEYDPLYDVVAPHFTLVFPTSMWDAHAFGAHLRRHAQGHSPIAFTLRCAIVVKDLLGEHTQTFLVPDQGFSEIVKLHDALYAGDLARELRLDIPFIPHITVASALDPTVCKRVADAINQQNIAISGTLHMIDITEHANRTVTTLERLPLA
jgi:2'-5' RNA ligase